ncbi:Enamine deaminase RidA, house cleaning of reactive enamine intermediates, YjgF/YER057c/UK114 family [Alteromonadaceae bacterium Bs31]|nr:Enamine deaminase RidA, house cleaning of reactive enamine intermediates, YjgF/YER057c/UK114 family [Alteromonadaceae bacterium Bs31]
MMKKQLLLLTLLLSAFAYAGDIKRYGQNEWQTKIGYSQAVAVNDTLYLSGIIGKGETMDSALGSAMTQLKSILDTFGLGPEHILKEKIYSNDLPAVRRNTHIRKHYYGKSLPAAVWIGVAHDGSKAWLEMEMVVHIPKGHPMPKPIE